MHTPFEYVEHNASQKSILKGIDTVREYIQENYTYKVRNLSLKELIRDSHRYTSGAECCQKSILKGIDTWPFIESLFLNGGVRNLSLKELILINQMSSPCFFFVRNLSLKELIHLLFTHLTNARISQKSILKGIDTYFLFRLVHVYNKLEIYP